MYSFSSCWNSHRHTDGRAMLREIRELGFEYAELSHGIRISLLPGIFQAVDAGEIRISTLHNFCPLPIGVDHAAPNLYQFSALKSRERESALRHTFKTLETAQRVGARAVVLHLGSVDVRNYTDKLIELQEAGENDTPKFTKLREEALRKIESRKDPHMACVRELLEKISEEASRRGVKLGVENREALEEIPLDNDIVFFLKDLNLSNVGYWHDTGHAQIKESLGVLHHGMHLASLSDRLIGMHIHDVVWPARDHRAPGTGTIDFASLKKWISPDTIKVFEFSPSLTREEALGGIQHVRACWGSPAA